MPASSAVQRNRTLPANPSFRSVSTSLLARRDEVGELANAVSDSASALWARMDATERFAADVAHELKNPLSSIRSAIETLMRVEDPARRKQLLTIIGQDVVRLDRLISDVSDASRVDAEMSRVTARPIDVVPIVRTLKELDDATRDPDNDPGLEVIAPPAGMEVLAVEDRLVQVLRNLIGNAQSFSPRKGRILVRVKDLGSQSGGAQSGGAVEVNALPELADYLAREVEKLARAGADFGLLASNTPHIVFDEVRRQSSIPLLSIVEATCEEAKAQRLGNLGLFGSRFTMQGRFFPDVFSREGITLVVPTPDEQHYIHEKYMGELVKGVFLPETRAGLLAIADRLKQQEGIQGVILGGTELPLILRNVPDRSMLFLDTTQIHVKAAVEQMLS